jgi:hypothetical protein
VRLKGRAEVKLSEIEIGVEYAIKEYGKYCVKGVFEDLTRYGRSYDRGPIREDKEGRLLKVRLNGTYQGTRIVSLPSVVSTWDEYQEKVALRQSAREEREKKSEASKERAGVVADHLVKILAEAGVKVDASLHGVIPGGSHWTVKLTVRDLEALYEELTGKGGER